MRYKIYRYIRIVIQLVIITLITWGIMSVPAGVVTLAGAKIGYIEIIPMAVTGAMVVVGMWLVVTLIFGRIYCSTVCPLGTLQDIAGNIPLLVGKKKKIFHYNTGQPWFVRLAMIMILVMAICFNSLAVSWSLLPFLQLSPYDTYIDIVRVTDSYIMRLLNEGCEIDVPARIAMSALINFVFVTAMGLLRGRDLCNVLCPVGAAMGTLNTLAIFHFDIDTDKCTHCRKCEMVCKSSCVNSEEGVVDSMRCVVCFDCVAACPDDAISYTTRRHTLSIPMLMKIKDPRPALTIEKK